MKDLKITKGQVIVIEVFTRNGTDSFLKVTAKNGESICNITTRNQERAEGNANIISEAINVANECGLMPRELLQQRNDYKERFELLEIAVREQEHVNKHVEQQRNELREMLKVITLEHTKCIEALNKYLPHSDFMDYQTVSEAGELIVKTK